MQQVEYGQCGLCTHFGDNKQDVQIIQIRTKHEAPEDYTAPCDLPQHAELNLMVTPISGGTGFEPADDLQAD